MRFLAAITVIAAVAVANPAMAAPNAAIENILVSKVSGVTRVQLWPACSMRYVNHSPQAAGLELRIRVLAGADCSELLTAGGPPEQYSADSLRLGNVEEILFDAQSTTDGFITLRFREPQKFDVRQHMVGWLEIFVDTNIDSATLPPSMPDSLQPEESPEEPAAIVAAPRDDGVQRTAPRPTRRANVPPSATGDFVVQLGVFDNVDRAVAGLAATDSEHLAYTTSFEVNGRTWYGLNLGFFDSEGDAESVLGELAAQFPDAWVRYAMPEEAATARSGRDVRESSAPGTVAVQVSANSPGTSAVSTLISEGRSALLDRRYDDAIASYTDALRAGDRDSRATAREMIAIAFERTGQTERAIAEYEAFLAEFPLHVAADRVNDRIAALQTRDFDSAEVLTRRVTDGWQLHGGISHYYWRNQEQRVHDGDHLVTSSGVLGLADMTASRRGSRFDLLARFNGAYQHNLVSSDNTGDVGWISNAFVDITDNRLGLNGRIGRQTRRQDGVLGRFDGIGLGYQWRPSIGFSVSAGAPVDSPRYVSDSRRYFIAAGAGVDDLLDGRLGLNAYTHQQKVDGIFDRQAVGGEFRYRDGGLSLVGLLDYDLSYAKLNTALVNANFAMGNGWTFNGRVHYGARPYLTTRNALAGQTATSIEEMLETYSEAQVRGIARDRTAQAVTTSVGLTLPWGERFNLTFDVANRQSDGTEESAGVAAIAETGTQMFYSARAVGTNILRQNDLIALTVRHESLRNYSASTVIADARFPVTRTLRFNPRLSVSDRESNETGERQTVVSSSLRVLWRMRNVLLDLEAGGRWSNRDLPPTELDPFTPDGVEDLYGGFVRLGYRLEF